MITGFYSYYEVLVYLTRKRFSHLYFLDPYLNIQGDLYSTGPFKIFLSEGKLYNYMIILKFYR